MDLTNNGQKPSRFSSLKVFKFTREKDNLKPPPLPPKDPYYLANRSLASLSPESQSFPSTPLSPPSQGQYPNRIAALGVAGSSTMSLVSNSNSNSHTSYSPNDPGRPALQPKKSKASSIFRFGSRSPKSPSIGSPREDTSVTPDDEGISMPWNFQHHVHVDEGFAGLPPSWTTSLAEHGFSEDEIAAIQARRAASRSPGPQYAFNERPQSPAASVHTMSSYHNSQNPSGLIRPSPRTTSLRREFSDTSLNRNNNSRPGSALSSSPSQSSLHSVHNTPIKAGTASANTTPRKPPPPLLGHKRLGSASSLSLSIQLDEYSKPTTKLENTLSPIQTAGISPSDAVQGTSIQEEPPKRTFIIANGGPILSPPPSYSAAGNRGEFSIDRKDRTLFEDDEASTSISTRIKATQPPSTTTIPLVQPSYITNASRQRQERQGSQDSTTSRPINATPPRSERRRSKRFNALPPRLSLHQADLSQWTEALISAIPSADDDSSTKDSPWGKKDSPIGGTAPLKPKKPPPAGSLPSVPQSRALPIAEGPSSIDSRAMQSKSDSPPLSANKQLFDGLEGLVGVRSPEGNKYGAPALADLHSPTLPISPEQALEQSKPNGLLAQLGQKEQRDYRSSEWVDDYLDHVDFITDDYEDSYLSADPNAGNRDSSRYSSRSSTSTVTMTPAVVKNASIARMAVANVIEKPRPPALARLGAGSGRSSATASKERLLPSPTKPSMSTRSRIPASPQDSQFGSSEESGGSGSSSSQSNEHQTPITEVDTESSLGYYLEASPSPSEMTFNSKPAIKQLALTEKYGKQIQNGFDDDDDDINIDIEEDDMEEGQVVTAPAPRPLIFINKEDVGPGPLTALNASITPMTPAMRYGGWISGVVQPLEPFIDEPVDPREYYLDLEEIAEGESGSVFKAVLGPKSVEKLKLNPDVKGRDMAAQEKGETVLVAMKVVEILPSGSTKLVDLEHELKLMEGLSHPNILAMDALYVDLSEDSLWVRMELMERSLADVIGLVEAGLVMADRIIARFAKDILEALQFLQKHRIAHRDVRSDNLLLNKDGILKLTDFSNALQCTKDSQTSIEIVGVPFWQAPEMRAGPHDALKVDVWSLGATVWEMAQAEPPFADTQEFADRWPPLRKPEIYPRSFHEFLRLCSEPPETRPDPHTLSKNSFVMNSCGRPVIIQLLSQCMAIEKMLQEADDDDS